MFEENDGTLNTRISANERFSDFDLNAWLKEHVPIRNKDYVLDVGCGNGNHLGIWSKLAGEYGFVLGMDKSKELIRSAKRKDYKYSNVSVLIADMDKDLPSVVKLQPFDVIISNFSIYYSKPYYDTDLEMVYPQAFTNLMPLLKNDGIMVVTGPTRRNARELYEYNRAVGGGGQEEANARQRATVIEEQVIPYLRNKFAYVQSDYVDHSLVFPSRKEFLKYYTSGALYKESKCEVDLDKLVLAVFEMFPENDISISKQTVFVYAKHKKG